MDEVDTTTVFGTPLEVGFRLLFLLSASDRRALDQQRLTYFDYIVVHSKDLGGAESIHPATPRQKSELLVKRTIVNDGLNLLISRDLIERRFAASGIVYRVTKPGRLVCSSFESHYSDLIRDRSDWTIKEFGNLSDNQLKLRITEHLGDWSDEWVAETIPGVVEDGVS